MSDKAKKVISVLLTSFVSAVLIFSSLAKITSQPMVVDGLKKLGYGPYILYVGVFEFIIGVLFSFPKTQKIGFLFVTSYLGGAAAIEIAEGRAPVGFLFIALAWVGMYLKHPRVFHDAIGEEE